MRRYVCWSVMLLTLILLPSVALASGDWKLVVRVKGKVDSRVAQASGWKPIFSSRLLSEGQDRIRTHKDSIAKIKSADGTEVSLGPDTEVTLEEFDVRAGRMKIKMQADPGSLRAKLGRFLRGQRSFEVETPNAVLAARGTDFIVVYNPGSAAAHPPTAALPGTLPWVGAAEVAPTTVVDVLEGEVAGRIGANGETSIVRAGQRFVSDGRQSSVFATPSGFDGIPEVLIPAASNAVPTVERGTMAGTRSGSATGDDSYDASGGAIYSDFYLPFLQGAATSTVRINLNVQQ